MPKANLPCWSLLLLVSLAAPGLRAEEGAHKLDPNEFDSATVAEEDFAWSHFINEARAKYKKQKVLFHEKAEYNYRLALADVVAIADEVHVFLLDSNLENLDPNLPPDKRFPILPYGEDMYAKVLEVKVLRKPENRVLAEALANGLREDLRGGGSKCHLPAYGVRIYRKDEQPFTSSFCWQCENYFVEYPDHAGWQEMGPAFDAVLALFKEIIPLPEQDEAGGQ